MSQNSLRVAHIDDDEDLRAVVRFALEDSNGCAVASCASGSAALEEIPSFAPDIILVDMLMPGMDGLQTVSALRQRMDLSHVAVVFATALDDSERLQELAAAGAAAVIRKPFDALKLAAQLRRIHGS